MFGFLDGTSVKKLAASLSAEYVDVRRMPAIAKVLQTQSRIFKRDSSLKSSRFSLVSDLARAAYKNAHSSDSAIAEMYDAEYGGSEGPHYSYLTALLVIEGFVSITGVTPEEARELCMIDVGAGSNELLRFCRDSLGVPSQNLAGTDISPASGALIARDGFSAYVGRIETLPIAPETFDICFLSYFVDYDTNQYATFASAIQKTKRGGRIILEGLFLCTSFGLLPHDRETLAFVIKGNSAAEDLELVAHAFQRAGAEQGRDVQIERITTGKRYVYSHYGLRTLPSYFLTVRV